MKYLNLPFGRYAFLAGLLLSAVLGLVGLAPAFWIVVFLGIVVALMNIETKETMKMLLWTIGMGVFGFGALVSGMSSIPMFGEPLAIAVANVGTFFMTIAGVFLLKIGYTMFSR